MDELIAGFLFLRGDIRGSEQLGTITSAVVSCTSSTQPYKSWHEACLIFNRLSLDLFVANLYASRWFVPDSSCSLGIFACQSRVDRNKRNNKPPRFSINQSRSSFVSFSTTNDSREDSDEQLKHSSAEQRKKLNRELSNLRSWITDSSDWIRLISFPRDSDRR